MNYEIKTVRLKANITGAEAGATASNIFSGIVPEGALGLANHDAVANLFARAADLAMVPVQPPKPESRVLRVASGPIAAK